MDTTVIINVFETAIFTPQAIIEQASNLGLYGSIIAVITGIVYMVCGWSVFRIMATILFAFAGFYLGVLIGEMFGWSILSGIITGVLFAVISLPFIRIATGFLIAIITAILLTYIWRHAGLPEQYILLAGVVGLVLGGLSGFYIFRIAVMTYTSLLGASIVLTGLYGFLEVIPKQGASETSAFQGSEILTNMLASVLVTILTIAGVAIQLQKYGTIDGKNKDD